MPTFSENRGIIRSFIPSFQRAGFNPSESLRSLRDEMGLHIRTQDFYTDWNEFTGRESRTGSVKNIRKEYKPTSRTISPTLEDLKGKYSYVGQVTVFNREMSISEVREWRYTVDDLITIGEAESMIAESFDTEDYNKEHYDIENVIINQVLQRVTL